MIQPTRDQLEIGVDVIVVGLGEPFTGRIIRMTARDYIVRGRNGNCFALGIRRLRLPYPRPDPLEVLDALLGHLRHDATWADQVRNGKLSLNLDAEDIENALKLLSTKEGT